MKLKQNLGTCSGYLSYDDANTKGVDLRSDACYINVKLFMFIFLDHFSPKIKRKVMKRAWILESLALGSLFYKMGLLPFLLELL